MKWKEKYSFWNENSVLCAKSYLIWQYCIYVSVQLNLNLEYTNHVRKYLFPLAISIAFTSTGYLYIFHFHRILTQADLGMTYTSTWSGNDIYFQLTWLWHLPPHDMGMAFPSTRDFNSTWYQWPCANDFIHDYSNSF